VANEEISSHQLLNETIIPPVRRAVEPERSAEEPAVSFCPSDLTAPNKSHRPPLCHPACPGVPWERTRISYYTALPAATYAALRTESRMKSTEATAFDRKFGEAEGPAVRPGSLTKVSVPLVLPQAVTLLIFRVDFSREVLDL
jgi:hypothetical protein